MTKDNSSVKTPRRTKAQVSKEEMQMLEIPRMHSDLYNLLEIRKESTWVEELCKAIEPINRKEFKTSQGIMLGEKYPPFNMNAVLNFKNQNPHHSTCIETKSRATCGLGFIAEEEIEKLDEICEDTFQSLLNSIVEDYWQVGNAYLEVVRENGKIKGLHYVPACSVTVVVEDETYNKAYLVRGDSGVDPRVMAAYGELDEFIARHKNNAIVGFNSFGTISNRSEIIHFARKTSMSRWYGFPDWLSAVPNIELVQLMIQERFDFFLNRGVPEVLVCVTGTTMKKEDFDALKLSLQQIIGPGNQHKSMALNLGTVEAKVDVHKLAMEGSGSNANFSEMSETLALDIVTAHRTPPVLAGITIPGKLGATNELPNALMAFQTLVIGPEQYTLKSILGSTLGDQKRNGGLKVRKKHFEFKKITDEIAAGLGQQQPGAEGAPPTGSAGAGLKPLDTLSRRRTPAASGGGGPLKDGVKK